MFTGELAPAQIPAANKLCARKRMLLAWPQGTGKTIISLACCEKLHELGYINSILILSPTGITWQWKEKIEEFTDHGNDVQLVEAANKSSRKYGANKSLYTIVPYSVFRKDAKILLPQRYDLIIADEAQEFSSFRSKTFKLISRFRPSYRWALTGTAISNKIEELYAIYQWVDYKLLPPWEEFEAQHLVRNPHTNQILKYKNIESLHKYLKATRLERKTTEELEGLLPELIRYKVYVEKDKEVKESELNLLDVLSNPSTTAYAFDPDISQALHRAKKALISEAKLQKAVELISTCLAESENNRIVVFSFYKAPIYELIRLLESNTAGLFTGDQGSTDREATIKLFRDGKIRVLICSDAGKAGLDLPFANYTIHLDVPYSFERMDQRSKRTQRVSSKFKSVVVIYLLVKDSIEQYYYQVTTNKGKLSKAVQEGGADTVVMKDQSLKAYLDDIQRKD